MKKQTPPLFNPVLQPEAVLPTVKKAAARKRVRATATKRSSKLQRVATQMKQKASRLTQRIKDGLTAKFAHLDQTALKKALIACGVVAAIAAAIVFLAKFTPLIVALLALLGLGAVLRLWDRVRLTI